MFDLLGALVGLYVVVSVMRGCVYAKRGASGERIERALAPRRFWTVILIYAGLALALVFAF